MTKDFIDDIRSTMKTFDALSLADMAAVQLLDRKDTKFVFSCDRLPMLLQKIKEHYKVLEIEGHRLMRYSTLYYDTPDFKLYTQHHNGKLNRYKIRSRTYVETDTSFFEIKFKSNKGRTVKERMSCDDIHEKIEGDNAVFLEDGSPLKASDLEDKLWVYYDRITLTDNSLRERVTIDIGLNFDNGSSQKDMGNFVIAELKQDKFAKQSHINQVLRELKIEPLGFSKYCIGIASLYEDVKKNNFKPKLRYINQKINHAIVR